MHTSTLPTASWGALLSGRNALRSIALAGGVGLHAINVYIVTTILPTVVQEIGGLAFYAWSTTLFVVTSIIGSTLSSKALGSLGPRVAYLAALAIFSIGTVVCALAPSMTWLLVGRSIQGLGGGILFALSYGLIRLVFHESLWPRAMALVSGMWGIATLCGPAVGGVFAQAGQWRWAFGALLPVAGVLALIVTVQLRGVDVVAPLTRIPFGKIALLVASVLAISLASLSTLPLWNIIGIAAGLGFGALIVRFDIRAKVKLLPTGAYSLSTRLGAIYTCMTLLIAGITTEIFVPYFLQVIHGFQPLSAGYLTAVMAAGWTVSSLYSSGRNAVTADRLIQFGPVIVAASLVSLAVLTPQQAVFNSGLGLVFYCVSLAGVGFGIGLEWPHLLTRVFTAAQAGEETLASSSITTVQLYGTAVAAAAAGLIANVAGLTQPGGVEGAQRAAVWVFGAFALAPTLAIFLSKRVNR